MIIRTDVEIETETTVEPVDMVVHLDIGPGKLDRFLKLVGGRRRPLIKYLDGSLTLVSPSGLHEFGADRIDGVIKAVCGELDIDYYATGSTLYRRPGRDRGIEADKSYYVTHARDIGGAIAEMERTMKDIDLSIHPPPDLVVEVVYSHGVKKVLTIYQDLGVPEIWLYRARKRVLEFLHLDEQGQYTPAKAGRCFPFLTPSDILPWVEQVRNELGNRWERRVREWVRAELLPRHRAEGGGA